MCNNYTPPRELWPELGYTPDWTDRPNPHGIFPRDLGPFIRASKGEGREQEVGKWALIPFFAKTATLPYSTNNARSEELASKASFKGPWAKGHRCIIPALDFREPCWETGKNVWHRFERADGQPWALAGLWNTWTDRETGEIVESYTMLTINADHHPIMRRMHKPDPKLPPESQDKRMVCVLEPETWEQWLHGTVDQAKALLTCAPAEAFVTIPEPR